MFLFFIGTISDSFLRTRHYPCTMYDGGRGGGGGGGREGLRVIWECFSRGKREDKLSQTEHEGEL